MAAMKIPTNKPIGLNDKPGWGKAKFDTFHMTSGIRQGATLSPCLFIVYVGELNIRLNKCEVGCHSSNIPLNNLSYVSLNDMLEICNKFGKDNCIIYSQSKTVVMCIRPKINMITNPPSIYLNDVRLGYVKSFKYLGHIINSDFSDDEDIMKENRFLNARASLRFLDMPHGTMNSVSQTSNERIMCIVRGDAKHVSKQWSHWENLYIDIFYICLLSL
nr:uncharacterized protein LOC113828543 [Penaeus vannamei]